MAFNPSSTIYLCNVPIDSSYKNQIYFDTIEEQQAYFKGKTVRTYSDYLTVRKTLPDGSFESRVRINANIDFLQAQYLNYMYYVNEHHGNKIFYAFITKFIYINEATTEIVFETDVYQTWRFDVTLAQSYVVREHSKTDEVGDNLVPEAFNFNDYNYTALISDSTLNNWGYLVATTEHNLDEESLWEEIFGGDNVVIDGKKMSGIYQGLFFYYYNNTNRLNKFLNDIVGRGSDCVVFIALIPEFCVSENARGVTETEYDNGEGWVYSSNEPAEKTIDLSVSYESYDFDGYVPKNKKLYTNPYFKMVITNHNGEQAEYNIEDFKYASDIEFKMYGDVSANPSITLIPCDYKGLSKNYDSGISISSFPQVSFNTDTFKLWLAKNQYGIALNTAGDVAQIIGGLATTLGTGGVAGAIGVTQIFSGVQGVLGSINSTYQASREPNKATSGSAKNNLLTAIGFNKFDYYIQTIKRDYAEIIDSFFTMYGYQVNKVKIPNVNTRRRFNYIQTIDVNIIGGIPANDMERLKTMYNSGVTLWKSFATVGNYNVDNSPLETV